jgi:hypothetical protein
VTSAPFRLLPLAAAGLLLVVACSGTSADDPPPERVAASDIGAARCSESDTIAGDVPGWPLAPVGEADFLPTVASSLITVGPNRFLYNVLDSGYRQMASAELPSRIDFYALERDAETPAVSATADYLPSTLSRGLYRAAVEFDCVGEWGAEVAIDLPDGSTATERLRFMVHPQGTTPAIGAPAPLSDSPVAMTAAEAAAISTDPNPYPAAYDKTVAETVTSGKPSLVFFATPAFCQTGYCGPTVELVKGVAREHEGAVEFVNVEPYELQLTENGLQPLLDEDGYLQPVPAALDYGIPVEPYLFLVDADGDVFAKFEGVIGGAELRTAIEDVLGPDPDLG